MAIKTGYGWKDIDVVILGNIPTFISEITYTTTHEKQNGYGRGNKPVRRQRGNKTYEVNMVLGIEEAIQIEQAIQAQFGVGFDPTDLQPFDIPVTYDNGEEVVTDIIRDFEWTEWGRGAAQGDMEINQTVPGICSEIIFNQPV